MVVKWRLGFRIVIGACVASPHFATDAFLGIDFYSRLNLAIAGRIAESVLTSGLLPVLVAKYNSNKAVTGYILDSKRRPRWLYAHH